MCALVFVHLIRGMDTAPVVDLEPITIVSNPNTDVAEVESGDVAEVESGDVAEVESGDVAGVESGDVAEVESGDVAEVEETDIAMVNEYTIDVTESSVNWEAGKVVPGGDHNGTVLIKNGKMTYTDSVLSAGKVVLDMTSIASEAGENLDGHLKNEDFFDVENYPEAMLEIVSSEKVDTTTNVTANLTIKDITKEITFPVIGDENWSVANFTIDRTNWDIKYGSSKFFDNLKDKAIRDDIEFEVKISYDM